MTQLILGGILAVLCFLLGAFLRPFLTKYSEKKGENLATHEDIDKLVDQVKAVTRTSEEIKAEISSGLWDRQKRWTMKREVLFEAAKQLSEIDDSLLSYSVIVKADREKQKRWKLQAPSPEEHLSWQQIKHERTTQLSEVSKKVDESRVLVTIVCSVEAAKTYSELGAFINKLVPQITEDPDHYDRQRSELFKKILETQKAIRRELDVDTPKPSTSG